MIIKDVEGKYKLEVDIDRNIVYETFYGKITVEGVKRLHQEYVKKIVPLFEGERWTKCCDFRKYKPSSLGETAKDHLDWAKRNGMIPGPMIVKHPLVKMQINMVSGDREFVPVATTNLEEAEEILLAKGF